jgi:hypothetical protein
MPKEGEKEEMETGYRLIFKRLTDLKSCVLEKVLLYKLLRIFIKIKTIMIHENWFEKFYSVADCLNM